MGGFNWKGAGLGLLGGTVLPAAFLVWITTGIEVGIGIGFTVTTSPAWLVVAALAPMIAAVIVLAPQRVGLLRAAGSGLAGHAVALMVGLVLGSATSTLQDSTAPLAAGAVILAVLLTLLAGGLGPVSGLLAGSGILVVACGALLILLPAARDWVFLATFYAAWTILPGLARPLPAEAVVASS